MTDIDSSAKIHPTAVIADGATIGSGTVVGPYSVIGSNVQIGEGNKILSHVVVDGHTTIGSGNTIYQFSSIGAAPQDLKYKGEPSELTIGNDNIIREYATLQPGTLGGGMKTTIGNKNLFMACSHVGHDGVVGNGNVFANAATLAGHVTVGSGVIIGGLAGIHQFVKIGDLAMIGAGSMVGKDIAPYCTAQGDRAQVVGLNTVGLERAGMSEDDVRLLKKIYRSLFLSATRFQDAVQEALRDYSDNEAAHYMLQFIITSERGVALARSKSKGEEL